MFIFDNTCVQITLHSTKKKKKNYAALNHSNVQEWTMWGTIAVPFVSQKKTFPSCERKSLHENSTAAWEGLEKEKKKRKTGQLLRLH